MIYAKTDTADVPSPTSDFGLKILTKSEVSYHFWLPASCVADLTSPVLVLTISSGALPTASALKRLRVFWTFTLYGFLSFTENKIKHLSIGNVNTAIIRLNIDISHRIVAFVGKAKVYIILAYAAFVTRYGRPCVAEPVWANLFYSFL